MFTQNLITSWLGGGLKQSPGGWWKVLYKCPLVHIEAHKASAHITIGPVCKLTCISACLAKFWPCQFYVLWVLFRGKSEASGSYGALEPLLNSWLGLISPLCMSSASILVAGQLKHWGEGLLPLYKLLMNFQVCLLAADSGSFLRPPTG